MILERLRNDGSPTITLNDIQIKYKKQVEEKIKNKHYQFETIQCIICNSELFETISEKDKHGLLFYVSICKNCGLVQTNPRMTKSSYDEFYNEEYRQLNTGKAKATESFFHGQYIQGEVIYSLLTSALNKKITKKFVLEIGPGAGGILEYFKNKGNIVTGLDIGKEYIEFGKQKGLDLRVGTVKDIGVYSQKPDIVIYSYVLEHVRDPIKELVELRKFLHKDSVVYIQVPNIKRLETIFHNQDLLDYFQIAHLYHFSEISLRNCVRKAGFDFIGGNQIIQVLCRMEQVSNDFENEYKEMLTFFENLEKSRINPPMSVILKKKFYYPINKILLRFGTVRTISKKIYYGYLILRKKL